MKVSRITAIVAAILLPGALGVGVVWLILSRNDPNYGLWLFYVSPFAVGALSGFISGLGGCGRDGATNRRRIGLPLALGSGAIVVLGIGLLAFGADGLFCICLAFPLALVPMILGVMIGLVFGELGLAALRKPPVSLLLLGLTLGVGWEETHAGNAIQAEYTSFVDIDADPATVWHEVVTLNRLPEPHDWIARVGVACPQTAVIHGSGIGAERDCTLTTGAMKERITAWAPEQRLGFVALNTPPPLKETNPFHNINPAHLDSRYYRVLYGEFRIGPLPGGRSRLFRLTRYEHRFRPALYWTWLCNIAADHAHGYVLDFVKLQSEKSSSQQRLARK